MKFGSFLLLPFLCLPPVFTAAGQAPPAANPITTNDVLAAEKLFGLDLPEDKLKDRMAWIEMFGDLSANENAVL